jgi:hypothetical protein
LHPCRCNNREKTFCTILEEEKDIGEERSSGMSYNMRRLLPESSAPPYPNEAPFPGYTQPPRKSYRWVWITLGIVALVSLLGCVLLGLGAGWAFTTYYNSSLRANSTSNPVTEWRYTYDNEYIDKK